MYHVTVPLTYCPIIHACIYIVRYRAGMRTNNLVVNAGSRVAYNIISGDNTEPRSLPQTPQVPISQSHHRNR